jgi:hypothetical protein
METEAALVPGGAEGVVSGLAQRIIEKNGVTTFYIWKPDFYIYKPGTHI